MYYEGISPLKGIKKWAMLGEATAGHGRLVFFFAAKRKQGSWKTKQAQREQKAEEMCGKSGGRGVQLRTTRPVPPFGGTAAGREQNKVCSKIWGRKKTSGTDTFGFRGLVFFFAGSRL